MVVLLLSFSGLPCDRDGMNVELLKGFFGIGIGAFTGEGHGGPDVLLSALLDLCRLVFGEEPVLEQTGAQDAEGVASFPAPEFFLAAILETVHQRPLGMMAEAVGFGFDQGGSLPCPCA